METLPKLEYKSLVDWATTAPALNYSGELQEVHKALDFNARRIVDLSTVLGVTAAHALRSEKRNNGVAETPNDLELGTAFVDEFSTKVGSLNSGLQAVYSSLVINAWTIFEMLATDLWVEALNRHPKLALLSGTKRPQGEEEDESKKSDAGKSGKTLTISQIGVATNNDFNLSCKMGSLLRGDFDFTSVVGIQHAYLRAFHKDSKGIADVLNRYVLRLLNEFRNVLVHRAGFVDDKFRRKAQKLDIFKNIPLNTKLALGGDTVQLIIAPSLKASYDLLEQVDVWLQKHGVDTHETQKTKE